LSARSCMYCCRDPIRVVPAPPSASAQASRGTHSGFVEGVSRSAESIACMSQDCGEEWRRSSYPYLGQIALQKRSMRWGRTARFVSDLWAPLSIHGRRAACGYFNMKRCATL
jgi:hypothetical protein